MKLTELVRKITEMVEKFFVVADTENRAYAMRPVRVEDNHLARHNRFYL